MKEGRQKKEGRKEGRKGGRRGEGRKKQFSISRSSAKEGRKVNEGR